MTLKPLNQQTILITGASSGIGLMTARMAAEAGARVVLVARNGGMLKQVVDEIIFAVESEKLRDKMRQAHAGEHGGGGGGGRGGGFGGGGMGGAGAEERREAAAARIGNAEQLERRDDRGFERGHAVDAFAEIEGEVRLRAAHAFDPASVGIHGNADRFVSVTREYGLDCFNCLEDGEVRRLSKRRDAIEEHDNFHVELRPRIPKISCRRSIHRHIAAVATPLVAMPSSTPCRSAA